MSIHCPSCGVEAADGARFCADCGSSLAHNCPNCGAEAAPGAKFCANCGHSLATKQEDPQRSVEERKVVSVLFADLAGFTARTETSDPEDVRARLTVYHKTAREQVEAHVGKVEKLMGDGVFAVFGVPTAHEDDSERAVRAALRLQEEIANLNEDDPDLGLSVRIAVTTGEAIVQLDADNQDRESIVGDVVNTASRLEAVAPAGGVVVDERTYLATRGVIDYDDLDSVALKGKASATPIWLATGARARQGVAVTERHKGPFVGRDRELSALVESLHRTDTASTVQMVTIVGEPGSGKSRLLHEFKAVLDKRPDVVWWKQGRCLPYGEGITFWALGEIIKAQAGILETDSESDADRKLHHAVASLVDDEAQAEWIRQRLAPLAGGATGEQKVEQGELFSAWLRFFAAMAQQHLLILVIEDIHWADDALLDFLEHLAEWAVDVPILLVAAARPELIANRSDWGGGIRNATTITLSPLANTEAAQLLSALLERVVLPAESQQTILEQAGGNPLYVTEFVRLAEESDLLDESGRIGQLGLPDSVQAIIGARLDLLGTQEKDLLQAASVVGKVFWSGAVAALRPTAHSRDALRELMRRELIRPIRDASMKGQEEYAFVHALVRDVAYGRLARDDRAHLHQATAGWMEAMSGERGVDIAELLAYHLGEAIALTPEPDEVLRRRAYKALMQAAERARELDARRGMAYYRKAAEAGMSPSERAEALRWIGILDHDDVDEALRLLEEAAELFGESGDPEGQALALGDMSAWLWWRGEVAQAYEVADRAARLLDDRPDSQAKAQAMLNRFRLLNISGDETASRPEAVRIAPLIEAHGSEENKVDFLARTSYWDGLDGLEGMRTAMRMADERNLSRMMWEIRNNLATVLYMVGSPAEALPIINEGIELSIERGMPRDAEWSKLTKAEVLLWTADWDEGMRLADDLIRADDERGGSQAGRVMRIQRDWMRFYRGDDVRSEWEEHLAFATGTGEQQTLSPTLALGVTVFAPWSDTKKILGLADQFDSSAVGIHRELFITYVTGPLASLGEPERIRSLLERSGRTKGSVPEAGIARAQGHLALAAGDLDAAAGHFAEAVAICDEHEQSYIGAEARVEFANVLERDDPRFAGAVEHARRVAERMGATRLLDRLDEIEGIEPVEAARA